MLLNKNDEKKGKREYSLEKSYRKCRFMKRKVRNACKQILTSFYIVRALIIQLFN